ncbi:MAG TPA: hypothetical protein DIW17_13420 [Clostridiales bacterium]|nr:hypothetical protein [Clostridia bacterium]HCS74861.1 hypothetical protein [Clostridiales bacterium]
MLLKKPGTKEIAFGGIMLALSVLVLYMASMAPTGRLSLYALSSFFVSVIVIESGIKAGWLFYTASSLLSLLLIPDKLGLLPYFLFFGLYGLIKYYLEKISNRVAEYLLKFVYFNLCLLLAWLLIKEVFLALVELPISIRLIVIALQVVFFIYDWVYSLVIQAYRDRIRKILK